MYVKNGPVFYTNGTDTVEAIYSVQARDLEALGWKRVQKEVIKVETVKESEPVGEAVAADDDLHSLTKSELISYANEIGAEVKPGSTKQEIINVIEAAENG